jgi:hypothetical protein
MPGVQVLGCVVVACLLFNGTAKLFSRVACNSNAGRAGLASPHALSIWHCDGFLFLLFLF